MLIKGSCHCRNVTYELDWGEGESPIAARACGCSFCIRHGAAWTSQPQAALTVNVRDGRRISLYRFGTGMAEFHVCATCGCAPLVTATLDGSRYAVVNVRTFEGNCPITVLPASHEGESDRERRERWRGRWIAKVELHYATGW